jgi:hypothetical protein
VWFCWSRGGVKRKDEKKIAAGKKSSTARVNAVSAEPPIRIGISSQVPPPCIHLGLSVVNDEEHSTFNECLEFDEVDKAGAPRVNELERSALKEEAALAESPQRRCNSPWEDR